MNNEGTAIEKAIVRLMTEIDECAGGDTRARSIYKKSIGILQSMLPEEKDMLKDAYDEGYEHCNKEQALGKLKEDFDTFYKSIKLNK